jgi:hypothetical protein
VYKHNHHKNSRTHRQYHYGEDNPKNRYPGKDIKATYVLLSRSGVWLTSFYACKAAAVKKIAERIVNDQCGTLIVPMKNTGHQKYEPLQPAFYDEAQLLSKYLRSKRSRTEDLGSGRGRRCGPI